MRNRIESRLGRARSAGTEGRTAPWEQVDVPELCPKQQFGGCVLGLSSLEGRPRALGSSSLTTVCKMGNCFLAVGAVEGLRCLGGCGGCPSLL